LQEALDRNRRKIERVREAGGSVERAMLANGLREHATIISRLAGELNPPVPAEATEPPADSDDDAEPEAGDADAPPEPAPRGRQRTVKTKAKAKAKKKAKRRPRT
jgi:hypothetical protein